MEFIFHSMAATAADVRELSRPIVSGYFADCRLTPEATPTWVADVDSLNVIGMRAPWCVRATIACEGRVIARFSRVDVCLIGNATSAADRISKRIGFGAELFPQ